MSTNSAATGDHEGSDHRIVVGIDGSEESMKHWTGQRPRQIGPVPVWRFRRPMNPDTSSSP